MLRISTKSRYIVTAVCFFTMISVSSAYPAVWSVEGLSQAGTSLAFIPHENAKILPYEPISGNLILRNNGDRPVEFKLGLLTGASVVMNVIQEDGIVLKVPFTNAPIEPDRPPVLRTLMPGEETRRLLIYETTKSPLINPGVYRIAFALTENGFLQSDLFEITVMNPGESDRALLEALMKLRPADSNPLSISQELAFKPHSGYLDQIKQLVLSNPESPYAAHLAMELGTHPRLKKGASRNAEKEQLLGIAIRNGNKVVSDRASLSLAKFLDSQARHTEARGRLARLYNSPDPRVRKDAKELMKKMEQPDQQVAAEHRLSPVEMKQLTKEEGSQILSAFQNYYEALIAEDAERLGSITGLDAQASGQFLEKIQNELNEKGINAILGVSIPAVSDGSPELIGIGGGLFTIRVKDLSLEIEKQGTRQTLTRNDVLRLRRDDEGSWTVVVKQ